MVSATAGEGTSYGGGDAGVGKFRKMPFRRHQTTPYDRPPTALRNPRNSGWLHKLVDPAYKLISASTRLFFSSVLRKRLAPPPRLPEANQESGNRLQEAVPINPPRVQLPAIDDDDNPTNSCDSRGISELEQLFKQKTFTRSEIDRLTKLLRSKTSDLPNRHEYTRNESNVTESVSAFERKDEYAGNPKQENRTETHFESHRCDGHVTTPVVSSKVLEEDVASPAELAKAYMGSRPSEASPSVLGLRSQTLKDGSNLLKNLPLPLKSPVMSLVSKPIVRVGVPENGFMTPRTRGRSAIYHMARTPYSRVTPKGSGSTHDGYGGPPASSSQYAWETDGQHGSKQLALKRRSSVLEDDIGSVGPIRRLRQKTILSTPKSLSSRLSGSYLSKHGSGIGCDTTQIPSSSTYKLFSLDEPRCRTSITVGENADNNIASTSYTPVPSKSTEMAARILQQLEKLAPKEKSSEGKVVTAREKSLSKLTSNMLRGQDLRSLDDVDSSKVLQNGQDSHKLEDLHKACLPDARDINSQKRDNIRENVLKMSAISREPVAPSMFSASTISVKDTPSSVKPADSAVTPCLAQTSQQKRAFQMSAHELDDEIHSNEAACMPLVGRKEKLETCTVVSNAASVEAVTVNNSPVLSEIKTSAGPLFKKPINLGTSDAPVAIEKNTSFTIPTASFPGATFQPVVDTPQPTLAFDKIVPLKDPNAPPPLFISSLKNVDKVPSLTFSSSSSVSESLGLKSGVSLESRPENSNSLANIASGTSDTVPKIPELNKGDSKNVQKSLDMMAKSETSRSVSTSLPAHSIFSFGAPPNNSSLENGSVPAGPPIFSSPASVLASNNLTTKTFTNSFSGVASSSTATMTTSGTTTTTALSSSISTSAAAPSFPAAPVLKFGSSIATSSSIPTVSITPPAGTTDLKAKTEKETTLGHPSSSPFGGISFGTPSTESSIFGSSASATSSSANNMSQVSPFGTTTGSLAGTQVSPVATGIAAVTQSMPIQFGSSTSSPVFGTSGTITSTSSLFGSSNPSIFGSGTSFGLSSSASSSDTKPSGATSSLFASSWQPVKSPVFNSTFNSGCQSTGFSFGGSSVCAAATSSAPVVFASSTSASSSSIFSFTSAAATTSQVQPIFSSSLPVSTAASDNGDQMNMEDSMAEDPVQSSRPTIPAFGQPPTSTRPPGFVFGSQTPSGGVPFQFGGQQSQSTPQNQSPFQPSGSLQFGAGDSFSLGSGGGDKSGRRIVKVKPKNRRK